MTVNGQPTDRGSIHEELERARTDLHQLVASASTTDLRRGTDGTRWTNQQMLWHMAFGYLIVSRLLRLVRLFGRLPDPFSQAFAAVLNAGTRPFHHINYIGSVGGALVFHGQRLTRESTERSTGSPVGSMPSPTRRLPGGCTSQSAGTPSFRDEMTLEEVYRYGTQHYDFHRAQLTLE